MAEERRYTSTGTLGPRLPRGNYETQPGGSSTDALNFEQAAMDEVSPILEITGAKSVIHKLIEAVTTYVGDSYNWKTELKESLRSLRRSLPLIQIDVDRFERILTSYEGINRILMKQLMKFSYEIDEAEEVLDELEYLKLKKKFNRDKSRLSRAVDASFRVGKRFLKWDDVPERLRTCVKNLNSSAPDWVMVEMVVHRHSIRTGQMRRGVIRTVQMQQEILPLTNNSKITSSLSALSFKGREEEKGSIIQYLLGESAGESEIQKSENVHCLPLVAMGGMGKTALAQQVFNHFENVNKEHFHIKFWVRVSSDFNASSLMKKILESSIGQSESEPSELIPVKLKEILRSKRFLLVLDDAWDDNNQTEWEKLCAPLLNGQKGSWVILTTRLRSVADMVTTVIRGTVQPMMLQGLSNDVCRTLLYERAFAGRDPNEFPRLKEIGEEIVEKLKGVPLLAKSIGGVLNSKLESGCWESISRSEIWETPQDSRDEFIPALTLSYVMLPPDLKRCFSYCGMFPQDYKFHKQKLVCMWVAAGLIYSDGLEGSDEDTANCFFDILCQKSFFDVYTYNWGQFTSTEKDFYTMHDMLKCLARHVSGYECCRILHGAPSSSLDYNAIRHICISISSTDTQLHDLAKMMCKVEHLRTLWIQFDIEDPQKLDDFIRDACKSPRRIRVLIIESCRGKSSGIIRRVWIMNYFGAGVSCHCLESISDFVKLRFLDISAHWQPPSLSLSKSISKFHFLRVLIYNRKHRALAKDANKLTNLSHIYEVQENATSLSF